MSPSLPDAGGEEERVAQGADVDENAWAEASELIAMLAEHYESDAAAELAGSPPSARIGDAQLVRWIAAIVDRDHHALALLYNATFVRVFNRARWIVRRDALAEEVVEEVYLQVWRQAARFDSTRGTAIGWLLTMARSRALDSLRSESRFQRAVLDRELLPEEEPPSWDELLAAARDHAELHRALTMLRAQPRQLLALAYFRGLSHEEIASHMLLPLGTVKSQIRRALLTLRDVLGKSHPSGYSA